MSHFLFFYMDFLNIKDPGSVRLGKLFRRNEFDAIFKFAVNLQIFLSIAKNKKLEIFNGKYFYKHLK